MNEPNEPFEKVQWVHGETWRLLTTKKAEAMAFSNNPLQSMFSIDDPGRLSRTPSQVEVDTAPKTGEKTRRVRFTSDAAEERKDFGDQDEPPGELQPKSITRA